MKFEGTLYRRAGDAEYLQLLDSARCMFAPDPHKRLVSHI
jgi:hypothetical protein